MEIDIPIDDSSLLRGIISVPLHSKSLIIFAHGSGSGRNSPRNHYVANILNQNGFATLLADLLTPEEQETDIRTTKIMCKIPELALNKFNIKLLSKRLIAITDFTITKCSETKGMRIGYFGASTGVAAAIEAASTTHLLDKIDAIVSRGGRPDLASAESIEKVKASTLLIVGENDSKHVIDRNKKTLKQLVNSKNKELVMIHHAGHLFDEEGTLEQVANLANQWFNKNL